MKKLLVLTLISLFSLGLAGCAAAKDNKNADSANITTAAESENSEEVSATQEPSQSEMQESSVVEADIESAAIAKNVIGDKSTRTIFIYLPPSYSSSDKTYPVVYFLHGYGDSCRGFMSTYKTRLDDQFKNGNKEFILVALDGNNKTGGSFFVNSPASGNWEDFVVEELVTYMDTNYRTIANSDSRGISGYSMGGFGALFLALRHPDIYNSTLVFCPGVFAENDLEAVMSSWRSWTDVKVSYAQAFSPDINNTTDFGNILQDTDIEAQNQIWQDWMNGYSNWDQKLDDYLAFNKPLKAIEINYSEGDMFSWIPTGCVDLMKLMDEREISYSKNIFVGGHIVPSNAMAEYFVPFFGDSLTY